MVFEWVRDIVRFARNTQDQQNVGFRVDIIESEKQSHTSASTSARSSSVNPSTEGSATVARKMRLEQKTTVKRKEDK